MLNNSLFYSKSLNADRQYKWCCFDLMLPGKLEKVIDRQNIYNIYPRRPGELAMVRWSGFFLKTLDILQSPNNVEMIQSRWICFVTVSMVTKCCGVTFRQLDDVRQEMRKQFWWKPRHEMETHWKTLEYSDISMITLVPHFPICWCLCDQTSI